MGKLMGSDFAATGVDGKGGEPFHSARGRNLWLFFLCLTYGLSFFDRMLMVVLAELVKQEFMLSDKQLSLLTGASFAIMYGTFALGAGWLVDKYHRKTILVCSLSLWSLATMACGMVGSFIQLAFARALVGIGEAATVPVGVSMISDLFKPSRRPMATALFFSGGMVSVLASFAFGSWIAEHYGWRYAFLWAGPPGVIVALLIFLGVREPDREKSGSVKEAAPRNPYLLVWENKALVWVLWGSALAAFANTGMMQWLPIFFIRSHGLSQSEIGFLFGPVMAAALTAGMLLGGWYGNRVASKSVAGLIYLTIVVITLIFPLFLLALWAASVNIALVFTFLATLLSVAYAPCLAAAWQTICTPEARGSAGAITAFGAVLFGGAVCTFVVGALSDYFASYVGEESVRYAVSICITVFCLVAILLLYVSIKRLQSQTSVTYRKKDEE